MKLQALLAAALLAFVCCTMDRTGPQTDAPDVVLVTVDALRPDHLGAYGYPRPTSPNFDALAARGVLFDHSFAHASYTVPSVGAILTGKLPLFAGEKHRPEPLAAENETIAEVLAAAGYLTAAFVDNGILSRTGGWDQGFFRFEGVDVDEARIITDRALAFLGEPRNRPFFLWLHYLDPHSPYKDRAEYFAHFREPTDERTWIKSAEVDDAHVAWDARQVRNAINLYDGEIRYWDAEFGRLQDALRARGRPLLLLVTADHGEAFCEHGDKSHGYNVLDENIRVPLLILPPGDAPASRRVDVLVGLSDLFPTILDYAGLPPRNVSGRSLRPLIEGRPGFEPRPILSQAASGDFSIRSMTAKIVRRFKAGDWVFFDLVADPREMRPLPVNGVPAERREEAERLHGLLAAYVRAWENARPPGERALDPATIEALRSLGYVREGGQ